MTDQVSRSGFDSESFERRRRRLTVSVVLLFKSSRFRVCDMSEVEVGMDDTREGTSFDPTSSFSKTIHR